MFSRTLGIKRFGLGGSGYIRTHIPHNWNKTKIKQKLNTSAVAPLKQNNTETKTLK